MSFEDYKGCEECSYKGFLHMSQPFEIERCDNCAPDLFGDTDAAELHRLKCGCDWPEFDYHDVINRALLYPDRYFPDSPTKISINNFLATAHSRDNFLNNLPRLCKEIAVVYQLFHESGSDNKREDVGNSIDFVIETLATISSLQMKKELKEHWFWEFEEGVYNSKNDTWSATVRNQIRAEV
jgi:hypothetical protein